MESLIISKILGLALFSYLLGAIPCGVIVTRLFVKQDIRRFGSGNIGATNVRRIAGNLPGIITLAGDVLKGFAPVFIARNTFVISDPWVSILISAVALCAVLGHLYPIFFFFRSGGKGVATAAGTFLAISPPGVGASALIFLWVVWRYRRVSAGSLSAAATLPAFVYVSTHCIPYTVLAVTVAVLIFVRHGANIRRLRAGTEPAIDRTASQKKDQKQ